MVVLWDETISGRERQDVAGGEARSTPEDPPDLHQNFDGFRLFYLARRERWDEFIRKLKTTAEDILRDLTDPTSAYDDEEDTLLHVLAGNSCVPVDAVQALINCAQSDSKAETKTSPAAKRNHAQQTPLHVAVVAMPERTEIIKCLCHAFPDAVQARDSLRLRPIDILTQKIIMMEEVMKYTWGIDDRRQVEQMLDGLWAAVRVLVGADRTFLVHACLRSEEAPFALTERAIKSNKLQLSLPDSNGDIPLHIVARIQPNILVIASNTANSGDADDNGTEEDNTENDEGDFLERVLSLHPEAALCFNKENQLPLTVGIQAGRKWSSGIYGLLQANPAGIDELHLPANLFPLLIQFLSNDPDTIFRMLQSLPQFFLGSSVSTDKQ